MLRTRAILKHILRRAWGRLSERDYHLAMLVFLGVFIFATVANA